MTSDLGPADKRMRLRYSGVCRLCAAPLAAGADAIYERDSKTVRCVECATATGTAPIEFDSGVAGASARREHERRKSNREQRIRASHPKLGGLILALTDEPQSTEAWERGAIGEELLAERLTDLPDTVRLLHDRRIRGTRANIDHIAVTPSGVWVIDAKRYKAKRPSLEVQGGIIRPRVEILRIAGRDHSKLVDGIHSQVTHVTNALADTAIEVKGVLCFLDADWPLIGGAFTVNGIDVVWPRLLVKRMTEATTGGVDVDTTHARLAAAFPTA